MTIDASAIKLNVKVQWRWSVRLMLAVLPVLGPLHRIAPRIAEAAFVRIKKRVAAPGALVVKGYTESRS